MTLDEYAKEIGKDLRNAHNSRSLSSVSSIVESADNELAGSQTSSEGKKQFWAKVRDEFYSGQLLMEKQEGSSLHAVMREIERQIAERKDG